jgi:hypothetical protein
MKAARDWCVMWSMCVVELQVKKGELKRPNREREIECVYIKFISSLNPRDRFACSVIHLNFDRLRVI